MVGRFVLAALLAGLIAGLVTGALQHLILDPMIAQAETFEPVSLEHDHSAWMPAEGVERTIYTIATTMLVSGGFALLLAAVSLLAGPAITLKNAIVWAACATLAVHVAPSVGLPPALPGMPEADLYPRQLWWISAIAITGVALWLVITQKRLWLSLLAIAAVVAFFTLVIAPQPNDPTNAVPSQLIGQFKTWSLNLNALRWLLMSFGLAYLIPKLAPDMKHD